VKSVFDLIIDTIRMNRIKRLEKRLCKAVGKFMGTEVSKVTGYQLKEGKGNEQI